MHIHTDTDTHMHMHTDTDMDTDTDIHMNKLPLWVRTPGKARPPGRHFRDNEPAQNKLLKPGRVLTGALTVASVLVV